MHVATLPLKIGQTCHGNMALGWTAFRCPNTKCNELTLHVRVGCAVIASGGRLLIDPKQMIQASRLRPEYYSKPQPDYIPEPLRDDYHEACRICDLSPKAAATLARRCLQGINRDFWKMRKRTLHAEIAELEKIVSKDLWEAIDAVRKIGNIGAHFEEDVNKIVRIDPGEAAKLVELIEILFVECYVARHERQQRLADLVAISKQKEDERAS